MTQPIGIVTKAAGPKRMPWIGPRMGPVPAMFSRLMRELRHFGMGT